MYIQMLSSIIISIIDVISNSQFYKCEIIDENLAFKSRNEVHNFKFFIIA